MVNDQHLTIFGKHDRSGDDAVIVPATTSRQLPSGPNNEQGKERTESIQSKNFDAADETRTAREDARRRRGPGDGEGGEFRFEPGWRWSECIKPVAGTESCQATHVGTMMSGRLHIVHD